MIMYVSYRLLENALEEFTENQFVVGECTLDYEGLLLYDHLYLVN